MKKINKTKTTKEELIRQYVRESIKNMLKEEDEEQTDEKEEPEEEPEQEINRELEAAKNKFIQRLQQVEDGTSPDSVIEIVSDMLQSFYGSSNEQKLSILKQIKDNVIR